MIQKSEKNSLSTNVFDDICFALSKIYNIQRIGIINNLENYKEEITEKLKSQNQNIFVIEDNKFENGQYVVVEKNEKKDETITKKKGEFDTKQIINLYIGGETYISILTALQTFSPIIFFAVS